MGNGGSIRYKKPPEKNAGGDADTWRKPKEQKGGKTKELTKEVAPKASPMTRQNSKPKTAEAEDDAPAPLGFPSASQGSSAPPGLPTTSHLKAAKVAERSAASWQHPSTRAPPPVTSAFEDDDEDIDGFEDLADAAAKMWDELMSQKHESKKDFRALFHLGELKDGVERAARRAESLQRQAGASAVKEKEKRLALEEACARIEERGRVGDSQTWKLGDLAIRRGKGLCEISTVHHETDPPYFEVRMASSGVIAGTESSKLIALTGPEHGNVRRSLRAFEEAKAATARAEAEANQADEELKQQHESLTAKVESALKQSQESAPQLPMTSGLGGPQAAPPGLPDMEMVRKWAGAAPKEIIPDLPAPAPVPVTPSASYPDMKGVKEDLRGGVQPEASTPTAGSGTARGSGAAPTSAERPSAAAGQQAQFQPSGFPSFDDLKKMDKQHSQAKATPPPSSDYPSVHPSAARETFARPSAASQPSAAKHPPSRVGSKSETAWSKVPAGFPSFEPNECPQDAASQQPESNHRFVDPGTGAPLGPSLGRKASSSAAEAEKAHREAQAAQAAQQAAQAAKQAAEAAAAAGTQQTAQQAPSADVWVCYRTADGAPYYHSERTGTTVWVLPSGASARNPDGTPVGQAASDDPFAHLRQQEEQNRQEREAYTQWYAQYSAWYAQHAEHQARSSEPSTEPPVGEQSDKRKAASSKATHGANAAGSKSNFQADTGYNPFHDSDPFQQGAGASAAAPSKGPPPPRLLAGVEDQTIYAMKSAIMKEMEQMVGQAKPIAQRKKALRCLQIRWHPDKNPDKVQVANSVFQFIEESKAWFLYDPDAQEGG